MTNFRASSSHHLIARGRTKAPTLTQGAKTYLRDLWLKENCEYDPAIWSPQMEKGNLVEDESIELYARLIAKKPIFKNEQHFTKPLVESLHTGTPDAIHQGQIIEIKSCYNPHSFITADLKKEYWAQVQSYLRLTDLTTGWLIYTLVDLPEHLLAQEERKFCYQQGIIDPEGSLAQDALAHFRKQWIYSTNPKYPAEQRLKIYKIDKDPDFEENIMVGSEIAMEYYNTITLNQAI